MKKGEEITEGRRGLPPRALVKGGGGMVVALVLARYGEAIYDFISPSLARLSLYVRTYTMTSPGGKGR